MEGLRGLAVFLVFLVHYVTLVEPWLLNGSTTLAIAVELRKVGNTGVDLFFVLSGYLIYGSLIVKPQPFRSYLWRRVQRIYPAFLIVLAIYLGLSWKFPGESKLPSEFTQALWYILQNLLLLPGICAIKPIITVAWSLSYEFFYYLSVPLLIWILNLRSCGGVYRIALFLYIAIGVLVYSAIYGEYIRMIMFISGIIFYEVQAKQLKRKRERGGWGLIALLGGLIGTWFLQSPTVVGLKFVSLSVCFFLLCLACFGRDGITNRLFCWTPLRWLGNMSYSYYLIHGLALKTVFSVLPKVYPPGSVGSTFFWSMLPVLFLLTLLPAVLLFVLVERPYSLMPKPDHKGIALIARQNSLG